MSLRLARRLTAFLLLAALTACDAGPRVRAPLASAALVATAPPPTSAAAAPAPMPAPTARPIERQRPAGEDEPPRVALGARGAVSSAESHASDVGLAVLQDGGNAVDAAIAVAFALAVTLPSAGNIGGGGFMVVRMADGRVAALDYRERAPSRAHRDMFLDATGKPDGDSLLGARAAGIPGTVAGMALAHRRFGALPWRRLVMPAVHLAEDGHAVDAVQAEDLQRGVERMLAAGHRGTAALYRAPGGGPVHAGTLWRQPALGATLRAIAEGGADAFYRGPLAGRMVAAVQAAGGIWEEADLAGYQAVEREPIRFSYRGHTVLTMPPPSGGGVVLRHILGAAELFALHEHPAGGGRETHVVLEAARRAYADRNALLGDPDFVRVPLAELLDAAYVRARMADIDPERATPSARVAAGLPAPRESEETTHFSVIDEAGNAVANTYTLNTGFGSKLAVVELGVLLNNEMDDFAVKPGSANVFGLVQHEQNRIEPGKRMLSSMTPTLVLQGADVRAVLGSPGGPTITTTVAQVLRALIDYDRPLAEAVDAVRLHHQWLPDVVFAEHRLDAAREAELRRRGHKVSKRAPIGHASCIAVDPKTHGFIAVADTRRRGGKAVAY